MFLGWLNFHDVYRFMHFVAFAVLSDYFLQNITLKTLGTKIMYKTDAKSPVMLYPLKKTQRGLERA